MAEYPAKPWPAALLLTLALGIHLAGVNQELFLALHRFGQHLPPAFWATVTFCGDTLLVLVSVAPFARRHPQVLWSLALAAVLGALVVFGLKPLVHAARPPAVLGADLLHVIGPTLRGHNSFPSGHALTAFTLAGVWALHLRTPLATSLLFAAAALVALSRVMVGVHWPVDILAGAAAGWLCAWAGTAWAGRWDWGMRPLGRRVLLGLLLLLAVALFGHDGGYTEAAWLAWLVAGVGVGCSLEHLWAQWRGPARMTDPPLS